MNRANTLRTVGALSFSGLIPAPARAAALIKLHAGAIPIDSDGVAFFAESQGYFAKHGIDVSIDPMTSGDAEAAAIISGDLDFGSINTMSLALAHQNGTPVKAIAPGAAYSSKAPTTQLMVLKSSSISDAKDLTGKTVGINVLKGIAHVSLLAWIDQHGGDSKSIKVVEMPFSVMPVALTGHRVDAAVVAEPALTVSKRTCRVLGNSYDGFSGSWLIDMYVSKESWIKAHPGEVRAIRASLATTAAWANGHHAETVPLVAKFSKLPPAVVARTTRATYAETLDPAMIQPVIDVAAKYGILTKDFRASDLIA